MLVVNLKYLVDKHHTVTMREEVFEGYMGERYGIHEIIDTDTLLFLKSPPN